MTLKKFQQIAVLIVLALAVNLSSCKKSKPIAETSKTSLNLDISLCDSIKLKGSEKIYCKEWFDKNSSVKKVALFSKTRTNNKEEFFVDFHKQNDLQKSFVSIYDFIEDCPVDYSVNFIEDSFSITDVDDDGVKEISFLYELACQGGIGPIKMKSVLIEGGKKYLIRGYRLDHVSIKNNVDPKYPDSKADKSFKNAPKNFLIFSKEKWNKFHGTKLFDETNASNTYSINKVSFLDSNIVLELSNNQIKKFKSPYFIEDENPKISLENNRIILYCGDDYGNSVKSNWLYLPVEEKLFLQNLKGVFPLKNKEKDNLKTCILDDLNIDIQVLNSDEIYNLLQESNNCNYQTM